MRERRLARGLSQAALAEAVGISRQSVSAIEAGRATPGVDVALRLARALDTTVEQLFGAPEPSLCAEAAGPLSGRVVLAELAGRWVAHGLAGSGIRIGADGLATSAGAIEPLRRATDARDNVIVMGCSAAIGLLADRLSARAGPGRFVWIESSSTRALEALRASHTHAAGVHLVDARTKVENVADVKRHAGKHAVVLVTLAHWEAGLVTAAGNPKRIRGSGDLGRRGLRLVTREAGSGARRLLDGALASAGVRCAAAFEAPGHLAVAQAVAIGAADTGIATRDAAIAFGLGFVPLAEERYDLVIPSALMDDPRIVRLLNELVSGPVRRELSALGYDVRACGDRVAEVNAA